MMLKKILFISFFCFSNIFSFGLDSQIKNPFQQNSFSQPNFGAHNPMAGPMPEIPEDVDFGKELENMMNTEEGRKQMEEQFRFIAELTGEDPESFSAKMMEETAGMIQDPSKMQEFNSAAKEIQKSSFMQDLNKEGGELVQKHAEKEEDVLKEKDEKADSAPEEIVEDEVGSLVEGAEKDSSKKTKASKKSGKKALTWQEGILKNSSEKKLSKELKDYLSQAVKSIEDLIEEISDKLNDLELSPEKEEAVSNPFEESSGKILVSLRAMNRTFYKKALFLEKNKPIREGIVELHKKLEKIKSDLFKTKEVLEEKDQDDDLIFQKAPEKKETGVDKTLKEVEASITVLKKLNKKLEDLKSGPEAQKAIQEKKKSIEQAARVASYLSPDNFDRYSDYFNRPGGYDDYYNPGYSNSNPYQGGYDPYNSQNNSPKRSSSESSRRKKDSEKESSDQDSKDVKEDKASKKLKEMILAFTKSQDVATLKEISTMQIGEDFYKKVSKAFLKINFEKLAQTIEEISDKTYSKPASKDGSGSKDEKQPEKVGKKYINDFKNTLKDIFPAVVRVSHHPKKVFIPIKLTEKDSEQAFTVLPFVAGPEVDLGDENLILIYKNLEKDFRQKDLDDFFSALKSLSSQIEKIKATSQKLANSVERALGSGTEKESKSSAGPKDKELKKLEGLKKKYEKEVVKQKIEDQIEAVLKAGKNVTFSSQSDFPELSKEALDFSKTLEILVKNSIKAFYSCPLISLEDFSQTKNKVINLIDAAIKPMSEKVESLLKEDSQDEKEAHKGWLDIILDTVDFIYQGVEDIFGVEDEKDQLERVLRSFNRSIVTLSRIFNTAEKFKSVQAFSDWSEFFKKIVNPNDISSYQDLLDEKKFSKKQREEMWRKTSASGRAKIPDFISAWCKGMDADSGIFYAPSLQVVRAIKKINIEIIGKKAFSKILDLEKVKQISLQDIFSSQVADSLKNQVNRKISEDQAKFIDTLIRILKIHITKLCLEFIDPENIKDQLKSDYRKFQIDLASIDEKYPYDENNAPASIQAQGQVSQKERLFLYSKELYLACSAILGWLSGPLRDPDLQIWKDKGKRHNFFEQIFNLIEVYFASFINSCFSTGTISKNSLEKSELKSLIEYLKEIDKEEELDNALSLPMASHNNYKTENNVKSDYAELKHTWNLNLFKATQNDLNNLAQVSQDCSHSVSGTSAGQDSYAPGYQEKLDTKFTQLLAEWRFFDDLAFYLICMTSRFSKNPENPQNPQGSNTNHLIEVNIARKKHPVYNKILEQFEKAKIKNLAKSTSEEPYKSNLTQGKKVLFSNAMKIRLSFINAFSPVNPIQGTVVYKEKEKTNIDLFPIDEDKSPTSTSGQPGQLSNNKGFDRHQAYLKRLELLYSGLLILEKVRQICFEDKTLKEEIKNISWNSGASTFAIFKFSNNSRIFSNDFDALLNLKAFKSYLGLENQPVNDGRGNSVEKIQNPGAQTKKAIEALKAPLKDLEDIFEKLQESE